MAYENELTPASIAAAAHRLKGRVLRTPLELSEALSEASGTIAYLKMENLQRTGSFKIRGALNRLMTLTEAERAAGVVAASAGNHALGVAEAARQLGARATLMVPTTGSPAKIAALRRYPPEYVELLVEGADYDETEALAIALARDSKRRIVSAYNDPQIISGQATIGVEILEDLPDVEAVLVPSRWGWHHGRHWPLGQDHQSQDSRDRRAIHRLAPDVCRLPGWASRHRAGAGFAGRWAGRQHRTRLPHV